MTRIGTPLSPNATKVMLLGAGELGKEVIIELQRLGVETIAVDRYAGAPGQQVAHRAHVIAMTDAAALRALVEQERPHIIVPEIEAIATDELAKIEAEGLAVVIPTARAVQLTMNREGIRRLAAEELRVPTSPYAFASSAEELKAAAARIGYPVFVKPVMSSSGKGQSLVDGPDGIDEAWAYALGGGRVEQPRVIVEGKIDFEVEITLLTVRARHPDGAVVTEFCAPIGHRQVKGDYVESWQPQPISAAAQARAETIALRVTSSLGGFGVFGVELFVAGDEVWFSEVSPRPHDTGLVTLVSQWQSEFALHARAILGLPVDVSPRSPGASAVIYGGMDAKGIAFDGVAEALAVPTAELRLFGKPESYERRRMGVALARGDGIAQARTRAPRFLPAVNRPSELSWDGRGMVGTPPRILIVDDDPVFRAIAAEALAHLTPHLFEAEDGDVALKLISDTRFDLVITDIHMPKRDGLELIVDVRSRWPDTVVVAVTGGSRGFGPDLLLKTAALLGAHVIPKPIRPSNLVEVVSSALGLGPEPNPVAQAS
jgi:phosphoribosylglycinamide formyltransferase 2